MMASYQMMRMGVVHWAMDSAAFFVVAEASFAAEPELFSVAAAACSFFFVFWKASSMEHVIEVLLLWWWWKGNELVVDDHAWKGCSHFVWF